MRPPLPVCWYCKGRHSLLSRYRCDGCKTEFTAGKPCPKEPNRDVACPMCHHPYDVTEIELTTLSE